ncbi:MAG: hypothetical protein KKG75_00605 [Nanoarchaeota archaeon]|nr:hypothetical protein [Nanoarchaeota archaeon]
MNKRGQSLIQVETIEYVLLVAIAIMLFFLLNTAIGMEKFNGLRADDLALTINSVFIPKGNVAIDYEMGEEGREIKFYEGIVGTYIDDPIRESKNLVLVDSNYIFERRNMNTNLLEITKQGDKVTVR